ncbi:MAG: hypothetical protein QXD62_01580 [Candidatus Woesearchaeota archaeon]
MKKSQSLNINTIIIAALGVLVLIVSIVLFSSQMGKQSEKINRASTPQARIQTLLVAQGELDSIINELNDKKFREEVLENVSVTTAEAGSAIDVRLSKYSFYQRDDVDTCFSKKYKSTDTAPEEIQETCKSNSWNSYVKEGDGFKNPYNFLTECFKVGAVSVYFCEKKR